MNVEITTVMGCRNNCIYCPQEKLLKAYRTKASMVNCRMMTLSMFKRILRKLPKSMAISFCGMSEPFQNPECTEMILYAHKKRRKVAIFTTLVGLKENDLKRIVHVIPFREKPCMLFIHLPSEGHFEHIPVTEEYKETLTILLQLGMNIDFRYLGEKLHPIVNTMLCGSRYVAHRITPTTRAANIEIQQGVLPKRKIGQLRCGQHAMHDSHVILPDGTVILCCMDYGMNHILGNILTDSYEAIYHSKSLDQVIRGMKVDSIDSICRYCEYSMVVNGISAYRNMNFSPEKIALGIKLVLFNHCRGMYMFLRAIKKILRSQNNTGSNADNYLQY